MKERQQSTTTYPMMFLLVSSTDHVTPVTGLTPTVTISKNGAGFGSPSGAVSEVGSGWYALAGNATDRATLGGFLVHATGTGADPTDAIYTIVPWDPFDGAGLGLTRVDAAISTRSTYAGADTSGTTTLLTRIPGTVTAQTGDAYARIGAAGAGLTALGDTRIAHLDADVSSRSTYAGGAVASVTAAVTAGTVSDKTGYSLSVTPPTAAQVRTEMDSNSTKLANLDAAVSTRSTYAGGTVASVTAAVTVADKTGFSLTVTPPTASDIATAVWAAGARTLTSFGTLVADAATAVWGAATRTLSAFGFSVTTATVSDKTGYTLTSPYDPAKTAAQAGDAMTLTGAYNAAKTAAQPGDVPTATQNADAVLARDFSAVTGAAARSLINAARALRNRVTIAGGTITVYGEDDSTVIWTGTVTSDAAAQPIIGVDPA